MGVFGTNHEKPKKPTADGRVKKEYKEYKEYEEFKEKSQKARGRDHAGANCCS
jgi:hypothetical protein